jgi:hypothetical protein
MLLLLLLQVTCGPLILFVGPVRTSDVKNGRLAYADVAHSPRSSCSPSLHYAGSCRDRRHCRPVLNPWCSRSHVVTVPAPAAAGGGSVHKQRPPPDRPTNRPVSRRSALKRARRPPNMSAARREVDFPRDIRRRRHHSRRRRRVMTSPCPGEQDNA